MNPLKKICEKTKRIWLQFRLTTIRDGWKKAEYIKKKGIFHYVGQNCFYAPIYLPAEPELVSLHDNVVISAGVRLVTHSVAHIVFNTEEKTNKYLCRYGKIEIFDNVYVGADAIIQFGTTINRNCIIAAGAIVTKDIESDSVVAGVPARKITTYEEAKAKARAYSDSFHSDSFTGDTWVSELIKVKPIAFYDKEETI